MKRKTNQVTPKPAPLLKLALKHSLLSPSSCHQSITMSSTSQMKTANPTGLISSVRFGSVHFIPPKVELQASPVNQDKLNKSRQCKHACGHKCTDAFCLKLVQHFSLWVLQAIASLCKEPLPPACHLAFSESISKQAKQASKGHMQTYHRIAS